jgi:hypothetical protein
VCTAIMIPKAKGVTIGNGQIWTKVVIGMPE